MESKKGEVAELRALLRNSRTHDLLQLRGIIERVIAYMTLGIDVSPLFTDMIMLAETRDMIQKKMIYLYLDNYAEQKSDLALLARCESPKPSSQV